MEKVSRITGINPRTGDVVLVAESDVRCALGRLAVFEDLVDQLCAAFEAICDELETLRAQGKTKTVTYRQLSANRASLKQMLALFEERGLC